MTDSKALAASDVKQPEQEQDSFKDSNLGMEIRANTSHVDRRAPVHAPAVTPPRTEGPPLPQILQQLKKPATQKKLLHAINAYNSTSSEEEEVDIEFRVPFGPADVHPVELDSTEEDKLGSYIQRIVGYQYTITVDIALGAYLIRVRNELAYETVRGAMPVLLLGIVKNISSVMSWGAPALPTLESSDRSRQPDMSIGPMDGLLLPRRVTPGNYIQPSLMGIIGPSETKARLRATVQILSVLPGVEGVLETLLDGSNPDESLRPTVIVSLIESLPGAKEAAQTAFNSRTATAAATVAATSSSGAAAVGTSTTGLASTSATAVSSSSLASHQAHTVDPRSQRIAIPDEEKEKDGERAAADTQPRKFRKVEVAGAMPSDKGTDEDTEEDEEDDVDQRTRDLKDLSPPPEGSTKVVWTHTYTPTRPLESFGGELLEWTFDPRHFLRARQGIIPDEWLNERGRLQPTAEALAAFYKQVVYAYRLQKELPV